MVKLAVVMAAMCVVSGVALGAEPAFLGLPSTGSLHVTRDGAAYLQFESVGFGVGWSWFAFGGSMTKEDGATVQHLKGKDKNQPGAELGLDLVTRCTGPRQLTCVYDLSTTQDVNLIYVIISIEPGKTFEGTTVRAKRADGSTDEQRLPLGFQGLGKAVKEVTFTDADGRVTTVSFDPAVDVGSDQALRVVLAAGEFRPAEPRHVTMTIDLPEDLTYFASLQDVPDEPGIEDWYAFQPKNDYDVPSAIGMDDWADAPAGAKGRVVRKGGKLLYGGEPMKFWGMNLQFSSCAPEKDLAEKHARMYRKFGVNTMRLHKYADGHGWAGIQSKDSAAEYDPEALDRMDYFVAKLKEAGVFVLLSTAFGPVNPGPADVRDIPYLAEFGAFGRNNRIDMPHSSSFYSPEIQKLHIRQMQNLLKHRNPYTGLTYAEDPCIIAFEILNEQSILFYTSMEPLKASETLRRITGKRFCDWLRDRYGTQEKLVQAWGQQAFGAQVDSGLPRADESLDRDNILPIGNPWSWDPEQLAGSQSSRKRRLLDSLEFLYTLQNEAYARWVAAARAAGYEGEILGSNWQAGQNFSHYYNLHSDYLVGLIDRHNYFGGFNSMLSVPGSGMLSSGMQQVGDRPFMLSEWMHQFPNEWGAEGPAIIGAYGLGLQDWDVSYLFRDGDAGGFSERLGGNTLDAAGPVILGLFPAVARQVRRQDVRPSDVLAPRHVHVPSLRDGKLGFHDSVTQEYDIKSFNSDKVPARTLAVARAVVEFTDEYRDTPAFDPEKAREGSAYVSTTGQLRWTPGQNATDGHFTMDTAATKAVVGFAEGVTCRLGDVTITQRSRFAAIYVTAKEPDKDLAGSKSLLVVAIARARNTGMKWVGSSRMVAAGKAPILMEPVVADITLARRGSPTVHVLDHDGHRSGRTVPASNGAFRIDGAAHKTPYYEIAYE